MTKAQPKYWTEHAIQAAISAVDEAIIRLADTEHYDGTHAKISELQRMFKFRERLVRDWERARDARIEASK